MAHHEVVTALLSAARALGVPARAGVTCTAGTFFPGQERAGSFTGYVPRRFQGATEEWRRLGVLIYEMEAATLLTLASVMGVRAWCVAGVVVNRMRSEHVTPDDLERGERNAVSVAVNIPAHKIPMLITPSASLSFSGGPSFRPTAE